MLSAVLARRSAGRQSDPAEALLSSALALIEQLQEQVAANTVAVVVTDRRIADLVARLDAVEEPPP